MSFVGDLFSGSANKFKADPAKTQQSDYSQQIGQAGANYQDIYGQQQQSNQALKDLSQGKGPNPALAQLSQTSGQNINAAQGQAASQRGVNPALQARMATDAAAQGNSAASGQAATMAAQQQLGATGMLANNLQGQGAQAVGLLGTAGGLQNQQNNTNVANTLGTNQINAGVSAQNTDVNAKMFGGLMNAAGGALSMIAKGGEVPTRGEQEQRAAAGDPATPRGRPAIHLYLDSLQQLHGGKPDNLAFGGQPGQPNYNPGGTPMPDPRLSQVPRYDLPNDYGHDAYSSPSMPARMPRIGEDLRSSAEYGEPRGGQLQPPDLAAQRQAFRVSSTDPNPPAKGDGATGKKAGDAVKAGAGELAGDTLGQFYRQGMGAVNPMYLLRNKGGEIPQGFAMEAEHLGSGGMISAAFRGLGSAFATPDPQGGAANPGDDIAGMLGMRKGQGGGGGDGGGGGGGMAAGAGMGAMMGGGEAMGGAGALAALSDERVKEDIHREPQEALPGVQEATFRYKGQPGKYEGVIAQDVEQVRPDLVIHGRDGLLRVPGELAPHRVMAEGGQIGPMFMGHGTVPGTPIVPGRVDTERNDKVPAMLSPEEIVLPRSVTKSADAPEQAKRFVEHLTRRNKGKGFDKVLKARKMAEGGKAKEEEGEEGDPDLIDSLRAWWKAESEEEKANARGQVDEAANGALPEFLSGRRGVKEKRAQVRKIDRQTGG